MKKKWIVFLFAFLVLANAAEKQSNAPKKILDPVYYIDVSKAPSFNAKIILENGKEILFCCPKAMFNLYFRPLYYPQYNIKKESDFKKLLVKDFLTKKWIDAKKALFVFGSNVRSPKGDDLIPVKSKEHQKIFFLRYGGSKTLTFQEIKKKGYALIKFLDMP
jgi:nitrous oxide reductase accessory protein NosL